MLAHYDRRRLRQGQRQESKLLSEIAGAVLVCQAGATGQELNRLRLRENVNRHAGAKAGSAGLISGDDDLARPSDRYELGESVQVGGVIEDHQAVVAVGLEPAPHRFA